MKAKWVDRTIFAFIGAYISYFALALVTDLRIDKLRPFITDRAVKEGVAAGVAQYKLDQKEDESLLTRKRKLRDRLLQEYTNRLTKQLDDIVRITEQ